MSSPSDFDKTEKLMEEWIEDGVSPPSPISSGANSSYARSCLLWGEANFLIVEDQSHPPALKFSHRGGSISSSRAQTCFSPYPLFLAGHTVLAPSSHLHRHHQGDLHLDGKL
ncbi:hypothetical protein LWI28_012130 [Acer negundo]|uniref:Uncharacterized protein n=1 Tax=Acer negundo TaxID=4023 RepID=A0AAD5J4Y3_ACENE|nr:hypothetical protein LWI28_012130 [Acer negundo]